MKAAIQHPPTPPNPWRDEIEEEFHGDLTKHRKVQNNTGWKHSQDVVYWIHLGRAQEKGKALWQRKSHAIAFSTATRLYRTSDITTRRGSCGKLQRTQCCKRRRLVSSRSPSSWSITRSLQQDEERITKIQTLVDRQQDGYRTKPIMSEASRRTIKEMGNIESCELGETVRTTHCPSCLRYSKEGTVYCLCAKCLMPSPEQTERTKNRIDIISDPLSTRNTWRTPWT